MSMVERVARAIRENDDACGGERHGQYWDDLARAAIVAMRLPEGYRDHMCRVTEAVQTEVDIWPEDKPKPSDNAVQFLSREEAVSIWNAGIDAALNEQEG